MNRNLEYISYSDDDRLAMLENRAAELERRIAQATPAGGLPEFLASDHGTVAFPVFAPPDESDAYADSGRDDSGSGRARLPGRRRPQGRLPRSTRWAARRVRRADPVRAAHQRRSAARQARPAALVRALACDRDRGGSLRRWHHPHRRGPAGSQRKLARERRDRADRDHHRLPELQRGIRAGPGQLRLREGHPAGPVGVLPADERQQPRLRRPVQLAGRASSRFSRPRAATSPGRSTCTTRTTPPIRSTACR